jgi:hypothetical protein
VRVKQSKSQQIAAIADARVPTRSRRRAALRAAIVDGSLRTTHVVRGRHRCRSVSCTRPTGFCRSRSAPSWIFCSAQTEESLRGTPPADF